MHVILRFYDHIEMYSRSEVECDRVCCVGQREEGVSSLYRLDGALNWAQFAARSAEIGSAGHVCPASEILAPATMFNIRQIFWFPSATLSGTMRLFKLRRTDLKGQKGSQFDLPT